MKILSVSSGYPNKTYRVKKIFAHEQNLEFIKQGCSVKVINLGADNTILNPENHEGIRVYKFKKTDNNILKVFKLKRDLKRAFKNEKYDLILFNGLSANQYFYLSFFKSISSFTAVIVHGTDGMMDKNLMKNFLKRKFLKKNDFIFPVSHYTDTLVINLEKRTNSSAKKTKVIYNGVDVDKFSFINKLSKKDIRIEYNIPNSKFVILTVCDLIERKGIDILIKALKEFSKINKDYLHIIIGRGNQEIPLKNLAKELGVEKNILFIDYVESDENLVKYYKMSDVYCMVSKTFYNPPNCEGFGISYIEASYLGLPVIGGNNGGSTTAIKHNFTGYLVDPYSDECYLEIANYLKELSENKAEYRRLSDNGRFMVSKEFSWSENVNKIMNVIKLENANK